MTAEGLADRVSRPRDCAFAVGIPTSEDGYRRSLHSPEESFVRRHGTYDRYWHEIVRPFQLLAHDVKRFGVRLVRDLTLDHFGSLCRDEDVHVVILFSHWDESGVELYDGFASTDRIIERVPDQGSAVLDLCVCHPCELVSRLHAERNAYLIYFRNIEAKPRFWLRFYPALFRSLHRRPNNYLKAFTELQISLLQRYRAPRQVQDDRRFETDCETHSAAEP